MIFLKHTRNEAGRIATANNRHRVTMVAHRSRNCLGALNEAIVLDRT